MKVMQFVDAYYPKLDGVVTVVDNYARHLNALGIQCSVAAPDRNQANMELGYPVFRYRSMEFSEELNYHLAAPGFDDKTHKRVLREKPELIHAHSPLTMGTEASRIASRLKVPLVATFHSIYYDDIYTVTKSKLIAKIGTQFVVNFYKKCDFVWTVNNASAETLRSYGYDGDIEIMPNGVDCSYPIDAEARRVRMRTKYNIGEDVPVFLFVGQQDIKKNIGLILKGVAKYKQNNGEFRLFLVGDGMHTNKFKRQAKELGISSEVIFTGKIADKNELNDIYLGSDLFLFPSLYDTFAIVVREAAVMHIPSVIIEGSNTADGIEHKKNGYLCKNDEESFYNCIVEAMNNSEERKRVGITASQTVCRSWESIVADVRDRYAEIIAWKQSTLNAKKRRKK